MLRRWLPLGAAALAVAWLLPPMRASGTVVVAKDFAALCDEADLIFVGTVHGIESRWSDPSHQSIETLVTFDDLTWLRGGPRPSVTLRFGGGAVDGMREEYAGVPRFTNGERRVIFAHEGTFVSPIVGFDQGAPRVVESPDGRAVVEAGVAPVGSGALRIGPAAAGAPMPLDEFIGRVQRQLAHPSDTP